MTQESPDINLNASQGESQSNSIKDRLLSAQFWLHFLYIILFGFALSLASYIMLVVVVLQFIIKLFTGETNLKLQQFSASLSTYIYQMLLFVSFNTEIKPFPYADWPDS